MCKLADELKSLWITHLNRDYPLETSDNRQSIVSWLLRENLINLDSLTINELALIHQKLDRRYKILSHRYLGVESIQSYSRLMTRLSCVVVLCPSVRSWLVNRDRSCAIFYLLQQTIQNMMAEDSYIQQQILWIARCTTNPQLRNALLFATLEEYCLQPLGERPLLNYRIIKFLSCQLSENRIEESQCLLTTN